jgi:hypothetical protein
MKNYLALPCPEGALRQGALVTIILIVLFNSGMSVMAVSRSNFLSTIFLVLRVNAID